ncbi:MAG TPA: NAD(P)H-dependent oxidoreductase, partial [Symbiobacteriaceae bacterium]|nr:NAD(P)H-dependent oxidoreductase [Symbiobacteriaceae bacterium]
WYDNGVFRGKRAMLAFTTGGPAQMFTPTGRSGDLNTLFFSVQHGSLFFCGFDVITPYGVYGAARGDDAMRQRQLDEYAAYLRSIDSQPLVPFHPLSDFDERLQLKPGARL